MEPNSVSLGTPFRCVTCSERFRTATDLVHHMCGVQHPPPSDADALWTVPPFVAQELRRAPKEFARYHLGRIVVDTTMDPSEFFELDPHRCLVCRLVFPSYDALWAHCRDTEHCIMRCFECQHPTDGSAGQNVVLSFPANEADDSSTEGHPTPLAHFRSHGHCAVDGVYRRRDTFRIGPPEPALPPQFRCASCGAVYRSLLQLAEHRQLQHGQAIAAVCFKCRRRGAPGELAEHAKEAAADATHPCHGAAVCIPELAQLPVVSSGGDRPAPAFSLFYQCPVCCLLTRQFSVLADHARRTGHGLSSCTKCWERLPLGDYGSSLQHFSTAQCAGGELHGLPISQRTAAVVVDRTEWEVVRLLHTPEAFFPAAFAQPATNLVLSCPAPQCGRVFHLPEHFVKHLCLSRHGILPASAEEVGVWEEEALTKIPDAALPPHLLGRRRLADFVALVTDTDMLELGVLQHFSLCSACGFVYENGDSKHGHVSNAAECQRRQQLALEAKATGSAFPSQKTPPASALNIHMVPSLCAVPTDSLQHFLRTV